jgi:transposase
MFEAANDTPESLTSEARRLRVENQKLIARNEMLENENRTLLTRITELVGQLAQAQDKDRQLSLQLELKVLRDRVNEQNRHLYGSRSEKRGRPDSAPDKPKRDKKKKRSGSKRTPQLNLARETQLHLLDDADRICPKCGGKLHPKSGQVERCERIVVTERIYTAVTDEKQIYGCGDCGTTDTALEPVQLVPGGRYDTSIAVQAAVDKHVDHLPLNRQTKAMRRAGLRITRQALWN